MKESFLRIKNTFMSNLILANDGIDAAGKFLLEKAGFEILTEKFHRIIWQNSSIRKM